MNDRCNGSFIRLEMCPEGNQIAPSSGRVETGKLYLESSNDVDAFNDLLYEVNGGFILSTLCGDGKEDVCFPKSCT